MMYSLRESSAYFGSWRAVHTLAVGDNMLLWSDETGCHWLSVVRCVAMWLLLLLCCSESWGMGSSLRYSGHLQEGGTKVPQDFYGLRPRENEEQAHPLLAGKPTPAKTKAVIRDFSAAAAASARPLKRDHLQCESLLLSGR